MVTSVARIRIVFATVLLGLAVSACGYNNIPTYEEQAKAKWADVENNYQRRSDLIPNLDSSDGCNRYVVGARKILGAS